MARRISPTSPRARGGFTLAEALIASVVLAVAVIGISATVSASYQNASGHEQNAHALMLARQLMEEIAAKPVALPSGSTDRSGCSSGNTDRATYDTVDDYNGYTDSSSSLTTLGGTSFSTAGGATMTRNVSVRSGACPSGNTLPPAQDMVLVTVTVSAAGMQDVSLSRLMTNITRER